MSEPELHIYAQPHWHTEAYIVGTPDALRSLAAALLRAADGGAAIVEAVTNDGEGYFCCIASVTPDDFGMLQFPYTDNDLFPSHSGVGPWDIRRDEMIALIQDAIREASEVRDKMIGILEAEIERLRKQLESMQVPTP